MGIRNKFIYSCLILVFGLISFGSVTQAATVRLGKLTDNANVRDSAGYTKVVTKLKKNSEVTIVGETVNWYQVVMTDRQKGWVIKWLISPVATSTKSIKSLSSSSHVLAQATTSALSEIISSDEINEYWQTKINALRKAKGLRELVISKQLIRTATEWSTYLGQHDEVTHTRPDGKSPQQWIADQDVDFTERNSDDGWKNNFFAENLGLKLYIKPTAASIKAAMDAVLKKYLAEGPGGVHYRSIYHPDWNSLGASSYPVKNSSGTYSLYFVFHYGSLVL